jgi:hypothetical protein
LTRRQTASAVVTLLMLSGPLFRVGAQQTPTRTNPPASTSRPTVSFAFERKGIPVSKFTLNIQQDGSAIYEGEEVAQSSQYGTPVALPPHPFHSAVSLSPATSARVFELAHKANHFNITCTSKLKNIADTGTKTLTYSGPDAAGACTYNYSDVKEVQTLTEIFEGVAETMDKGRELDRLRRYDRLGLDAAIKFLAQEVAEGRALEVQTIAASLNAIASDTQVMDRVRAKANALLALAPAH